jgi:flavin reductase (DIM6/NTAB) family NADH-FMN oxidoreductase RutF
MYVSHSLISFCLYDSSEHKTGTVNIISEHFLEAANATSINSPYGISEWALVGLHPATSSQITAPRVAESIFSIEAKLVSTQEFESKATPGKKTGVLAIVEGVRFWAREDAINEDKNLLSLEILRPIARLGGITYGRVTEVIEIPRPDFAEWTKDGKAEGLLKARSEEEVSQPQL